ncbi:class I SAM-dependent methyltransferase [Halopseudomonas bauzanensis]|uniref:class I SAM-dependent methyltransferase n=1 Tax=Halopseudomonas bauzanensis TaxID=653930 RepID=UPI0035255EC6
MDTQFQPSLDPAEVYERYLSRNIADPWTRVLLDLVSPKSGDHVLDLACGTGSVARQVAPLVGEDGRVVAVDINPGMLKVGSKQQMPDGATIIWDSGDATQLGLSNNAFDIVFCQQGFQFFPDQPSAVLEMRRVLRPGGKAVVSVWQSLKQQPLYHVLFSSISKHLEVPAADLDIAFSLGTEETLHKLFSTQFKDVQVAAITLPVRIPEPAKFVQFSILGAATSIPSFANMDAASRLALIEKVTSDTLTAVQGFVEGGVLVFDMSTHIVVLS